MMVGGGGKIRLERRKRSSICSQVCHRDTPFQCLMGELLLLPEYRHIPSPSEGPESGG